MKHDTTYLLIKLAKINQLIFVDKNLEAMDLIIELMDDLTAENRKEKHE